MEIMIVLPAPGIPGQNSVSLSPLHQFLNSVKSNSY